MKRKFSLLLMFFPLILCTGCSFLSLTTLSEKYVTVYSLIDNPEGGQDIETYKNETYDFKIRQGEEECLYLSLTTYSDMIRPYFKDGYSPYISDDGSTSVFAVLNSNNDYVFATEINPRNKTIWSGGSLSEALTIGTDYSKSSLNLQMDIEAKSMREATLDGASYYGNTSYKVYRRNGITYYPLSLLDSALSTYVGIYHLYNYRRIIQFNDYDQLSQIEYMVDNQKYTAFQEMKSHAQNSFFLSMPNYLIEDRANAFFFVMDNFYGLAQTRKIGSMVNYYKQQSYYDYFYSNNNDLRNEAFYAAIGLLDDGHSAVREDESAPWYTKDYNYSGNHLINMIKVRNDLTTSRNNFYTNNNKEVGDVLYSTTGKLAFFSFDSFNFDEEAYLADGETLKDDLYKTDTYFQFIKNFNDIKTHGGVKTIVIDVSINGGGVLGIMMKLLALLSKDNKSPIYLMDDKTMMVEKEITSVDSNGDEEYKIDDCYGNDFNFAILTSGYSFSCGNAFPYYAGKCGYAQIIGQTSAGGECTVEESMLPSGEHFFHSSNLHIGYFDEEKRIWSGDEAGAPLNQEVEYSNFYNLDYLDQLLNN